MQNEYYLDLFRNFINSLDISEQEKEAVLKELYSEDNISKMPGANYLPDQRSKERFSKFIEYLYKKYEEYGVSYMQDALKYAFSYQEDNNNFMDQFIKFIVVTNFDEIQVNIVEDKGILSEEAILGGLEVSHNRGITYLVDENRLMFEWFHNRRGLKRTKLGSLMMVELFKYVLYHFPCALVFSDNVRRVNVDAQEFYKKMGFTIIDRNKELRSVIVQIDPNHMMECISNYEGSYPILDFCGKEYDYTTYKGSIERKHKTQNN